MELGNVQCVLGLTPAQRRHHLWYHQCNRASPETSSCGGRSLQTNTQRHSPSSSLVFDWIVQKVAAQLWLSCSRLLIQWHGTLSNVLLLV